MEKTHVQSMVKVGESAPDFEATASGKPLRLSDFKGKQHVVLFFYPGDFTPVCTKEACYFRDNTEDLKQRGAAVLGISRDDEASHDKFRAEYNLPYELLSDPDGRLIKQFGLARFGGLLPPKRATFVIDKEGIVRGVIEAELGYRDHVDKALTVLDELNG